jgi:hypothetical protein
MVLYAKETDDITALQDEHQRIAINFAVGKAKWRDRAFGEASAIINMVYQELNMEMQDKHFREQDQLAQMKKGVTRARP